MTQPFIAPIIHATLLPHLGVAYPDARFDKTVAMCGTVRTVYMDDGSEVREFCLRAPGAKYDLLLGLLIPPVGCDFGNQDN